MAITAEARHRWDLDGGGTIGWVALGDAVLLVPGGLEELRRELLAAADRERRPGSDGVHTASGQWQVHP